MIVTRARGRWRIIDVARFLRLFPMGASVVHPLVGLALTVWPRRVGVVTAVIVAGVSFHVFSFVLNDIRDLPIDASEPRRQTSPLVRGMVSTSAAAWLTAAACLLGVALIAIVGGLESVISYLIAVLALGIYDLFGKRMPIPGLADVIQGLGWGSLLMAGAYI
nr:UbiA family prenyltransferase [Actinomycetota bacterium]